MTLLRHYHEYEYVEFDRADISAFLTVPIIKSPILSQPAPRAVSYTVRGVLDLSKMPREVPMEIEQRFKKAIKALRLDAPHAFATAERKKLQASSIKYEENGKSDEDHSSEQVTARGEQAEQTNSLSRTGTPKSDRSSSKRPAKPKYHCIDCGSDICQGRFEARKPELMMLGSGELEAYNDDDY